ncbi:MAG: winged helix-turn-helix transcriptional regulator, partial [Methanothrix sp.]
MELNNAVRASLEKLKKSHSHSVSIAKINGAFYVYEVKSEMRNGVRKSTSFYLGKIEKDGTFVPARHKKRETEANSLDEAIKLKYASIDTTLYPDSTDLAILEAISANGRASMAEVADYAGITVAVAKRRLKLLELKYDIKYIPEFGPRPFGFFRYVVFVRFFKGKVPDVHRLKEILEKEPTIQFAAMLKGRYHLFMYVLAESTQTLEDTIYRIRSQQLFSGVRSFWQVSYMTYAYGYTPIRQEFLETLKS